MQQVHAPAEVRLSAGPRDIPTELSLLWEALMCDSGADVAVIDFDGVVRHAGGTAGLWPFSPEQGEGLRLDQLMPAEIAAERLTMIRLSITQRRPLAIEGAWKGVPARTVLRPFVGPTGEVLVLAICRASADATELRAGWPPIETVRARSSDRGPVAKLTPRETEVLALIAQGHTTAQIAKTLFRSAKTIEAHRLSLGLKLKVRNRVELTRIAMRAGLHRYTPSEPKPVAIPAAPVASAATVDG